MAELAGRFDADLRLSKAGGPGPVSARSLTGLMTLVARKGDELIASASGPQAAEALTALTALADEGFGDGVASGPGAAAAVATASAASPAPRTARPAPREPRVSEPEAGAVLHGIAASTGLALGPVRRFDAELDAPAERASQGAAVEQERLESARRSARAAIERDRDDIARRTTAGDAAILTAHLALLDDEALVDGARAQIDAGDAAEMAWYRTTEQTAQTWRALDDELMRERATDVEDVGRRVLAALSGREPGARISDEGILVVSELTPADAAALDPDLVQGIAAARGTATAHAAILARALGIPAVVGLGDSVLAVSDGTPVLLNGEAGTVLVAPDPEVAQHAEQERARALERRERALNHASEAARDPRWSHDRGGGEPRRCGRRRGGRRPRRRWRRLAADGVPVPRPS